MSQSTKALPSGAVPVEIVGQTIDELSTGLAMMESAMTDGQKVRIELVTDTVPTGDDLAELHLSLLGNGHHISRPTTRIVDGLPVTSIVVKKGSPALALLIPFIPIAIIGGLITFAIFRIEKIANALMPILVVTFTGVIVLAVILTRKPVLTTAQQIAEGRKPRLLASTMPATTISRPEDMPPSGVPPVDFAQTEVEKGWKDFYKGNRVQASIDSANYRLEHRKVSREAQDKLHESLKTDWKDLVEYQNAQAWGFARGKLNKEEAEQLYLIYGGDAPSPENWNRLTLAEKVAGTKFADELLSLKIKSKLSPKTATHDKTDGQERVWITSGGGTVLSNSQMVSRREFDEENKKAIDRGEMPATGEVKRSGKWERLPQTEKEPLISGNGKKSELDFFPDSPEYLAQTVDNTGWRQQLDQTFREAITRARSS